MPITDNVAGKLVPLGIVENQCFKTYDEFVKAIPEIFGVEVPSSVTNVTIGAQQPSDSQTGNLWVRTDPSGNFVGFYTFSAGAWRQAYQFAPNQIIWMYGESTNIPDGFQLVDQNSQVPTTIVSKLMIDYVVSPIDPSVYIYFAVTFIGYEA